MSYTNNPDDPDVFDRLLEAMPRIAEAVNTFSSEKNQRAALDALVCAIGLSDVPSDDATITAPVTSSMADGGAVKDGGGEVPAEPVTDSTPSTADASKTNGSVPAKRRRVATRKWEPVRDINFRPENKQSFKDLVAEKQPVTIDQKNIVAVWWLEQIAEIPEIGVGHVLAAYKECDWREPSVPDNALQVTASKEHWLDTRNMKAVVSTPSGRNVVQYDMPFKKKDKKA